MKNKIVWVILSCLLVLILVLASCGPGVVEEEEKVIPEEEEEAAVVEEEEEAPAVEGPEMVRDSLGISKEKPRYGGIMRFSWTGVGAVGSWDVAAPSGGMVWHLSMYELPTGADITRGPSGTGELPFTAAYTPEKYRVGELAESWEQPDLQTVIIHFRKGINYHNKPPVNGREMVAADYAYCVRRAQEHPRSYFYKPAGTPEEEYFRVEVMDKYTARVLMPNPETRPFSEINFSIYPPELVEEFGDLENWQNACGTGAWICTDYVPDSSLAYVKSEDYWGFDPFFPENRAPYADGYTVINVPEQTTQLAALRTGKIDWLTGVSWEDAESLWQTNPELKYSTGYETYNPVIDFRNDLEPFSDIRFRKALTLAIDRRGLVRDLFKGNAEVFGWPYRPETKDIYIPLDRMPEDIQELFDYDPEKARQFLAEAGYPEGYRIELLVSSGRTHVDLAQIIKQYWDAIGVETTVKVLEVGTFYSRMWGKRYDQSAITHQYNANPFYIPDVHYGTGKIYNYSKVSDPYIDEMSLKLMKTPDPDERSEMFKEIGVHVLRQCYNIPLPLANNYVFWQPWVKGYSGEWWGIGNYRWLDLDLRKTMLGK
jgi:peptide/nickel transport system substrate-binding protein